MKKEITLKPTKLDLQVYVSEAMSSIDERDASLAGILRGIIFDTSTDWSKVEASIMKHRPETKINPIPHIEE
jgi:hypothetical protein